MSTLRIGGVAAGPGSTPTGRLRIGGLGAFGTPVAGAKLRVGGITATGTPSDRTRLRVGGITATGSQAIQLASVADRTIDPFEEVSTTVKLLSGGPAVSYTWRQVIGSTVTLLGSGPTRTFTAPARLNGTTVQLGVTATDANGNTSAEQIVTIQVPPHTIWYNSDNTGFKAVPMTAL